MITVELVVVLTVAMGVIGWLATVLLKKRKELNRFQGIIDLEAEQARIKAETAKHNRENEKLKAKEGELRAEERSIGKSITRLKNELGGLEGELDIQSYGLYEPKYDFGTSKRYKSEIDTIRKHQKQMIRDKTAILCDTEWTVGGSKAKGSQMVNRQSRLMLRAFNGECDSIILKVKYNNIGKIEDRIESAYNRIFGKYRKPCYD